MSTPFNVFINPGVDQASSTVSVTGVDVHIITDDERNSFAVGDDDLRRYVFKSTGRPPASTYVKDPTPPFGNIYNDNKWGQVQVTVKPKSANITSWTSKPVVAATQKFVNNSNKDGIFNVSISEQLANTVESNWSVTKTIDVTQTINYSIGFLGTGGGGSTSFSYSQAWAKGGSESQTQTIGSSQAVQVTLHPNQTVYAQLSANMGTATIEIVYGATISQGTVNYFFPAYQGFPIWLFDLPSIMSQSSVPTYIEFTDTIKIDYVVTSTVQLFDRNGLPMELPSPLGLAAGVDTLTGVDVDVIGEGNEQESEDKLEQGQENQQKSD